MTMTTMIIAAMFLMPLSILPFNMWKSCKTNIRLPFLKTKNFFIADIGFLMADFSRTKSDISNHQSEIVFILSLIFSTRYFPYSHRL
jgi:hypothetical protein